MCRRDEMTIRTKPSTPEYRAHWDDIFLKPASRGIGRADGLPPGKVVDEERTAADNDGGKIVWYKDANVAPKKG